MRTRDDGRMRAHRPGSCLVAAFALLLCFPGASLADSPATGDSLLARAERAMESDDLELAERLLEEADALVDDGRVENGLARVALGREDYETAIREARRAVKRDRRNPEFHLTLAYGYGLKAARGGMSALFYAGKYKQACEKAIEYDPENAEAHFAVLQYYLMAPGIVGGGEEKAEETMRVIEALDPFYGHVARGIAARVDEDVETAEREYRAAAHLDTTSAEGWAVLGMFYMEQERYEDTILVGRRILELEPDNLEAVYALAKAHLLAGDGLEAAEAGFRRNIREGPVSGSATEAEARWRLGMVLDRAGRPDEARDEWTRAL
ncbi:MAG: tetratricopeptide repeat protein, partial [Candidatus Eisenbacteria bacterium]|nr:tetratricopeptide repeat protein [Candidatus Eisenbacteria bacterium]